MLHRPRQSEHAYGVKPTQNIAQSDACEGDGCFADPHTSIWFCPNCDCFYCDRCWEKQAPHKKGKAGYDGYESHEKTNRKVFLKLKAVFEPPDDETELALLHLVDEEALWLAVKHKKDDKCTFKNTGRWAAVMSETKQFRGAERYPQLVSFIGQTGAGKSTLIKMLIDVTNDPPRHRKGLFTTPITGSSKNDRLPTSNNVHLYLDPATAFNDFPLLYADCEGLEGGEVTPTSEKFKEAFAKKLPIRKNRIAVEESNTEFRIPAAGPSVGVRESAVKNIFPRILYTFSDVVVFVLKNTRTFASTALKLLLKWAATSIESSVNQPNLPHVIIVLNASDNCDQLDWDVQTATNRLMESTAQAVLHAPIKRYAEQWIKKGKTINNTRDLIRCYYADVKVVRIPVKGRYMLIKNQLDKLYEEIGSACNASHISKWEARQTCTVDEFSTYLQAGIDHFTTKQDEPFNFIDVATKLNPIPQSFTDHLLALARAAESKDFHGRSKLGMGIFTKLGPLIASYIFLDCIRYRRMGKPEALFTKHYAPSCSAAIDIFANRDVVCTFGNKRGRKCVNSRLYHQKGHQDLLGKIFADGEFQGLSDIEAFTNKWLRETCKCFVEYETAYREIRATCRNMSARNAESNAHEIHKNNLIRFFENYSQRIDDRQTCYGCLMEVPQNPLPCGHTLCTPCVKMLGHETDKNTVTIDFCCFEMQRSRVINPCSLRFKPDFAGVRMLSLDGGGMRGIVELECLRAIQGVLGPGLPVRVFFDLIIGTSTGGIIALGLGVKQWTVDQSIARFLTLCTSAFTPWTFQGIAGARKIELLIRKSKYQSKPLRDLLKQELGTDLLYGQVAEDSIVRDTKVCVTATSRNGEHGVVIGNYTRQSDSDHWYQFLAGGDTNIYQAASATSAAPKYFRKFSHQLFGENGMEKEVRTYMDGALYYNNPVRVGYNECRCIWPDMASSGPDLVLSIGTGKNGTSVDPMVQKERFSPQSDRRFFCNPELKPTWSDAKTHRKHRNRSLASNVFEFAKNRLDSILDAELEFKIFQAGISHRPGDDISGRNIRLNPDLGQQVPELDDTSEMVKLKEKVERVLKTPGNQLMIERIALRMVASTFYFSKNLDIEHDETSDTFICTGRISCRFEGKDRDRKELLRSLGHFLVRQTSSEFRPYFTIKEKIDSEDDYKIEIDQEAGKDMEERAHYHVAEDVRIVVPNKQSAINMYLCLKPDHADSPELYPLSGFPRFLITEDASTAFSLQKRSELIKSKVRQSTLVRKEPPIRLRGASSTSRQSDTSTDEPNRRPNIKEVIRRSLSDHDTPTHRASDTTLSDVQRKSVSSLGISSISSQSNQDSTPFLDEEDTTSGPLSDSVVSEVEIEMGAAKSSESESEDSADFSEHSDSDLSIDDQDLKEVEAALDADADSE